MDIETNYERSIEKLRHDSEELECVNMFLDTLDVNTHLNDKKLSTVGRIKNLLKAQQHDLTPFNQI